jgi:dTDP-4-dehydrorhamnose 3,5-epimerase
MQIQDTQIQGVKVIQPEFHEDYRGTNFESFNKFRYHHEDIAQSFIVDSISTSRKHVLRGIHGDYRTTKLISCLYGTIFFVVIDWRPDSDTYGDYVTVTLSDRNKQQVLVPPGCGNAHLVMSDECVFSYKLDQYYDRESQFTLKWNDDRFNIPWPIKHPILSERDR